MFFCKSQLINRVIFKNVPKIFKRHFRYERPRPVTPCTLALKHFDDFYKSIFKNNWPSVRLGLLSKEKKVAVINNFAEVQETKNLLECAGAFDLRTFLEVQKANSNTELSNNLDVFEETQPLDETINIKVKQVEENELNVIYPQDKDVKFKAKFFDEDQDDKSDECLEKNELSYDPVEALTSMHSDFSTAAIDKTRLIVPDSEFNQSSLCEFVPASKLRGLDEFISESEYYKYYDPKTEMSIETEQEYDLEFPENLNVYIFDRGDISQFPGPRRCVNDVYNYLPMNGGDLLAVLALDIKPGEMVLDWSENSGSHAFCAFNTLTPKVLFCHKNNSVESMFQNYLYDYSTSWKEMLFITQFDSFNHDFQNKFQKILLDVCCTDDRLSISNSEDNYFANIRLRDRLQLPQHQTSMLASALNMVCPGGTVVYTTRTMSPIQNDGVVVKALETAWRETNAEFCVKDLSPALRHANLFFNFGKLKLKYGTLVVPFLPSNFGPKYICKIVRKT